MPEIPELADSPPEVDEPHAVFVCEHCESTFDSEDDLSSTHISYGLRRRNETQQLCTDCRWTCADCNEYFADGLDHCSNASDESVCESCRDNYFHCDSCDSTLHNDYYGRNSMCRDCTDSVDEEESDEEDEDESRGVYFSGYPMAPKTINNYSYKPRAILTHAVDETVSTMTPYYGVEIEGESTGTSDRREVVRSAMTTQMTPGFWYAKEDSSLGNGAEFVSHPATWRYWSDVSLGMFENLRNVKWRSYNTTTCGMHVHISRSAFSKLGIVKLMRFFKQNAPMILALSRRANLTALNKYSAVDDASNRVITFKVKKPRWDHGERYAAINLENAHTVEIRIFRGTLDATGIRRNIALCHAFTHFVRWAGLQQLTARHFVQWLRGNGRFILGKEQGEALIKWVTKQVVHNDINA